MSKRIFSLSALISLSCLNLYATETTAAMDALSVAIIWAIGITVSFIIAATILLVLLIRNIGRQRCEFNIRELYNILIEHHERGRKEGTRESGAKIGGQR